MSIPSKKSTIIIPKNYADMPARFKDNKRDNLSVTQATDDMVAGNTTPNVLTLNTVVLSLRNLVQSNKEAENIPDASRKALVQKLLIENPKVMFLVSGGEAFEKGNPNGEAEVAEAVHKRFGIPYDNLVIAGKAPRALEDRSDWAEDAIRFNLSKKDGKLFAEQLRNENKGNYFLHRDMSGTLKIGDKGHLDNSPRNSAGGDQEVVQLPNGKQALFFGTETIKNVNVKYKKDGGGEVGDIDKLLVIFKKSPEKETLLNLALTLKSFADDGINLDNQYFLGDSANSNVKNSSITVGSTLSSLSAKEKALLKVEVGDAVYATLEKRKDLPLPIVAPNSGKQPETSLFHIDLFSRFIADKNGKLHGMVAAIANTQADDHIASYLKAQGVHIERVPQLELPPNKHADGSKTARYLNYTNGEIIKDKNGETVYFMPTESASGEMKDLTANDKKAYEAIQKAFPNTRIVPVGGESAKLAYQFGGLNCLAQFAPVKIEAKP